MSDTQKHVIDVLKSAQNAFMNKDYEAALDHYQWVEKKVQHNPVDLAMVQMEIGWCFYLLRDYAYAAAYLEKVSQSADINSRQLFDCLRLCGLSHQYTGNREKAIAFLKDALLQPVEDAAKRHIFFELGKIYFVQNASVEAKPYLEKALPLLETEDREYLQSTRYYLGFIAFLESEYEIAEQYFQQIIADAKTEKEQVPGHFGMAHLLYRYQEYPALMEICQKIIQTDENFYDRETLGFFLCKSYFELEMWKELGVFLPRLMTDFPKGRYHSAYPEMEKAMRDHTAPPSDISHLN